MNWLTDKKPDHDTNELFPSQEERTISQLIRELYHCPNTIKKTIYYYLLSETADLASIETFIRQSIQTKYRPIENIHNPSVYNILRIARQVQRQIHKLQGLLRFKEIEGDYLYASFSSDFDVIVPLTLYFSQRLNTERIILHDTKRHKAMYAEHGKLYTIQVNGKLPADTPEEVYFQTLWRQYFETVSIEQRKNKKLQKQNVPLKFQSWVSEFKSNTIPFPYLHKESIDTMIKDIMTQIFDK
ncbi:MAG TPA: TIGR03915 family putative DNA repair protein [Candidatus Hydrogenedens sp.]|nr:TIGR03915 family putative DNA repair protein [Candidatus Hydrogenedens sp.]